METVMVNVGRIVWTGSRVDDQRKNVEFVAEVLGRDEEYNGDNRGVARTLYRADDGRLVVHSTAWSRFQNEPTEEWLELVTEDDLCVGGRFEDLGDACGFGRPLTLDEALARSSMA